MPYVNRDDREAQFPASEGVLNYKIHELINQYIRLNGDVNYANINAVIGVLECVKLELYRRIAAGYEDKKKEQNGDIRLYESFGTQ